MAAVAEPPNLPHQTLKSIFVPQHETRFFGDKIRPFGNRRATDSSAIHASRDSIMVQNGENCVSQVHETCDNSHVMGVNDDAGAHPERRTSAANDDQFGLSE
jgi:hypothetical protein